MTPGNSMRGVADRHGIDRRLLYMWKSRLKKIGMLVPIAGGDATCAAAPAFLPIATVKEAPEAPIKLWIGDNISMEMPSTICPTRLAAILSAFVRD